ncbi:MAG: 7-cyano-7-deazaguanine synthase QueC [Methanobacteriales archaeon HGW-Methanobacteriales-2]|nr:MAG: 7-cyano-7-deazaguanine synthase QueC [Methanobacteriales archaeon HGW-Methanobacteriales-2]
MEKRKKAISILSGGLDSAVATSLLAKDYDVHALTFDYGQRSAEMEIKSSRTICGKLGIEHTVIQLPWLAQIGGSALTSEEEVPELSMDQLDDKAVCDETARKVWVPGRNVVFSSIALSFAEAEGAEKIIVGWDLEEAATFPDNSKEFLNAFNHLLDIGSLYDIQIEAPLIDLNKKDIVKLGYGVKAPLELSYSCYNGGNEHCGLCESCMRRKRAFMEANIKDQVEYSEY